MRREADRAALLAPITLLRREPPAIQECQTRNGVSPPV